MNITLNIQAETPEELKQAIAGLAAIGGTTSTTASTTTQAATPEKPAETKRQQRTSSKPADSAPAPESKPVTPEPEAEAEDAADPEEPGEGAGPIPTDVELRAKATELRSKEGAQAKIKALLTEYGVSNITALPQDQRIAFMAELNKL